MSEVEKSNKRTMDSEEVKQRLPHRFPFLFVDKVLDIDLEKKTIKALKSVSGNEHFFQGHFPERPIMPGVLIVEALAQAGGILTNELGYTALLVLSSIKNVKFRKLVTPGDTLTLEVEALHLSKRGGRMQGIAKVDGTLAAEAEILYALVPDKS